jgi:hypothetical protein
MSRVLAPSVGNAGDDLARLDLVAVVHGQNRAHRQQVTGVRARGQLGVGVAVGDAHGRTQVRTAGRGAPVADDALGDARRFVGLFLDGQAFDQVLEADDAADFRQDRGGVGVPLRQTLALGLTSPPSLTRRRAPYGILWLSRSLPSTTMVT